MQNANVIPPLKSVYNDFTKYYKVTTVSNRFIIIKNFSVNLNTDKYHNTQLKCILFAV